MTTDLERRLRETLREDAQRARLVNPDHPPALDVVPTLQAARHSGSGRRMAAAAAALLVALLAAGLALRDEGPSRVGTAAPTSTVTTATPRPACPFTAEEVSAIIGAAVTGPESSTDCTFGEVFPSVTFGSVDLEACTPTSLRREGFSEAATGLGIESYSMNYSLGIYLLVCDGDQPFGVIVDGVPVDALTAAVALAQLALDG